MFRILGRGLRVMKPLTRTDPWGEAPSVPEEVYEPVCRRNPGTLGESAENLRGKVGKGTRSPKIPELCLIQLIPER